jgi:hypothetical protein
MKIELLQDKVFGNEVPGKRKFAEHRPYMFMIMDGELKGRTTDPFNAIKRGFIISGETYQQIQKDYPLIEQKKTLFCWNKSDNGKVVQLLRNAYKDGRIRMEPECEEYIKDFQATLQEIIDYLEEQ